MPYAVAIQRRGSRQERPSRHRAPATRQSTARAMLAPARARRGPLAARMYREKASALGPLGCAGGNRGLFVAEAPATQAMARRLLKHPLAEPPFRSKAILVYSSTDEIRDSDIHALHRISYKQCQLYLKSWPRLRGILTAITSSFHKGYCYRNGEALRMKSATREFVLASRFL